MPWTEIVTADWSMGNEVSAQIFPIEYPEDGEGWLPVSYNDGRPSAGVLSTNGLWWRYSSTASNANRKRANTISRVLLCNDYLLRPIDFSRDLDLLDEEAVAEAIKNDPACINCHQSLDPMAASLFGFWAPQVDSWIEMSRYHPDREQLYEQFLGVDPAFYGQPTASLAELGHQIAADPRFPNCAVEQVLENLLQRELELGDNDALAIHREAFLTGGLQLRPLLRSATDDPAYLSSPTDDAAGHSNAKLLSYGQLASSVEALTGFQWTYQDAEMLRNDSIGLRTLAGGADGLTSSQNARTPNATMLLVQARLAELAAAYAVGQEKALEASERRLFRHIDPDQSRESSGEESRKQLQHLHLEVLGHQVAADGPEVEAGLALWDALYEVENSPEEAWTGVLIALLRDPNFLLY